jgi:hypothetical protein
MNVHDPFLSAELAYHRERMVSHQEHAESGGRRLRIPALPTLPSVRPRRRPALTI